MNLILTNRILTNRIFDLGILVALKKAGGLVFFKLVFKLHSNVRQRKITRANHFKIAVWPHLFLKLYKAYKMEMKFFFVSFLCIHL